MAVPSGHSVRLNWTAVIMSRLNIRIIDGRKAESFDTSTKILVDVFRSTTTIPYIFAGGARKVFPTSRIREARELHRKMPGSILVGERWGVRIRGFDCNNSPSDIQRTDLRSKDVIFTSTNGTYVLNRIKGTGRILLGSFVNLSALIREVSGEENLDVVVSNRPDGQADEDNIFAEYLLSALKGKDPDLTGPLENVRKSQGAMRMKLLGYSRDLDYCLKVDHTDIVPEYLGPFIVSGKDKF